MHIEVLFFPEIDYLCKIKRTGTEIILNLREKKISETVIVVMEHVFDTLRIVVRSNENVFELKEILCDFANFIEKQMELLLTVKVFSDFNII